VRSRAHLIFLCFLEERKAGPAKAAAHVAVEIERFSVALADWMRE
jgi:hypothetical protein